MKSFFLLFTALFAVSNVFASVSNIDELEKRCNKGEGHECWWLGEHYGNGIDVLQSFSEANRYYEKACTLNDPDGCCSLGDAYRKGNGVQQSYEKAKEFYEKACSMNDGLGCESLADQGERT